MEAVKPHRRSRVYGAVRSGPQLCRDHSLPLSRLATMRQEHLRQESLPLAAVESSADRRPADALLGELPHGDDAVLGAGQRDQRRWELDSAGHADTVP